MVAIYSITSQCIVLLKQGQLHFLLITTEIFVNESVGAFKTNGKLPWEMLVWGKLILAKGSSHHMCKKKHTHQNRRKHGMGGQRLHL